MLCYTSVGYNKLVGPKFAKVYLEADVETGSIIRSIRSCRSIKIIGDLAEVIQLYHAVTKSNNSNNITII